MIIARIVRYRSWFNIVLPWANNFDSRNSNFTPS